MHIYPQPYLFAHTGSFCIGMDKSYGQALKTAVLVSVAPRISQCIIAVVSKVFFPKQDGEGTISWSESAAQMAAQVFVNFWFFRQVCLTLGSDEELAYRIGAAASGIVFIADSICSFLNRRRFLQKEERKQNNRAEAPDEAAAREFELKTNLRRVEAAALAAIAAAASWISGYTWPSSAYTGATIGFMTLVNSSIESKWSANHTFGSLVAIMISGQIAGALVS